MQGSCLHAQDRHCHDAGTLRSCDPDRVVLKKIVLSGYPVKVHKKKAVVRWMFHNPEDVRWFKPLELWTKYGRRGRIKVTSTFDNTTCTQWLLLFAQAQLVCRVRMVEHERAIVHFVYSRLIDIHVPTAAPESVGLTGEL